MYTATLFHDVRILVVTYANPFSSSDLVAAVQAIGRPGDGTGQHRALLMDLRSVSLSGISALDTRRMVAARGISLAGTKAEPAAFLIRSDEDFAYIRMHNLWSEAMGVREESNTVITTAVDEAMFWLAMVTNQPALDSVMRPHLMRLD